jgi:glycosyltransferase involved in cell wall biosynthesis
MKILILLVYYKRPNIVLNALDSIKQSTHNDWELCFIDDSGDEDFKETLFCFGLPNQKIKYIPILDSIEQKEKMGGVRIGEFMNKCILESDSDLGIMLCDDDALTKEYLKNLSNFFEKNEEINHTYSNVLFYHYDNQKYTDSQNEIPNLPFNNYISIHNLNSFTTPMSPEATFDASQVCWRLKCNKEGNVWFDEVRLMNHDEDFYRKLSNKYGPSYPTGFIGQCKGVSENQLGNRVRMKNKPYIID